MKEIILVTNYENEYRLNCRFNLNIDLFERQIEKFGYKLSKIPYNKIINEKNNIENKILFYSGTHYLNYLGFLSDINYFLSKTNILIPNYYILKCHEDKVYQELYKKYLKIKTVESKIYGSIYDLLSDKIDIKYPVILKEAEGASSMGVYKVNSSEELEKILKKFNKNSLKIDKNIIKIALKKIKNIGKKDISESYVRNYQDSNENFQRNNNDTNKIQRLIGNFNRMRKYNQEESYSKKILIQEVLPSFDGDWKIYYFGDVIYAFFRGIKENDFRSSGSGLQNYDKEAPQYLLKYIQKLAQKLDMPFGSFDVWERNGECVVMEFQGIHFGLNGILEGKNHYELKGGQYQKVQGVLSIEESYARAISKYLLEMGKK